MKIFSALPVIEILPSAYKEEDMYEIDYTPQAVEDLQYFRKNEQKQILDSIEVQLGFACNPMSYVDRVTPHRRVRFLVGANDSIVSLRDALLCAEQFPDGACYVVPGLAHGLNKWGLSFVDHVRYFLATQLGDWLCCVK